MFLETGPKRVERLPRKSVDQRDFEINAALAHERKLFGHLLRDRVRVDAALHAADDFELGGHGRLHAALEHNLGGAPLNGVEERLVDFFGPRLQCDGGRNAARGTKRRQRVERRDGMGARAVKRGIMYQN